ncbi:hypothetical protein QNE90_004778 [Vibrio alginolyticus]|nr:hypothetical protein [Vibrio alginolyticus]
MNTRTAIETVVSAVYVNLTLVLHQKGVGDARRLTVIDLFVSLASLVELDLVFFGKPLPFSLFA